MDDQEHKRAQAEMLWCMHVRGPDDVYPAPDYAAALKWSDTANELCEQARAKHPGDDNVPRLRAVPAPWPWDAASHAAGLAKSIEGWTPPSERSAP